MRLRKKKLEMILSQLRRHPSPRPSLEQYELSAQAAAQAVIWAWENGDVENNKVCDLGCGTGMLTIAASLSGAEYVCGVDLDPSALEIARENINIAEKASGFQIGSRIELKRIDVAELDVRSMGSFDTVVQNPPFGVQRRSSDRIFMRKALELANTVYSLHKRNPEVERFVQRYARELGGEVHGQIAIDIPIPHQFEFHRKPSVVVAADFYLIRRKSVDSEET